MACVRERAVRGRAAVGVIPGYLCAVRSFVCPRGRVDVHDAWRTSEVKAALETAFANWEHKLPANRDARVVLKPNLNNDLVALTGNCVDLRVLTGIIECLQRRGFRRITLCDGSNVGIARRGISTFRRLRIEALRAKYGINLVDLNQDAGQEVVLHKHAHPTIARTVFDADFLIAIPKVKTHAEAGLSCAMKNWVGIACGQDKRHMHYDLARNIFAINEVVLPDLIIVDGLVGMEGNGPGDGDPFRFGHLVVSDNAFLNDLVVCRLVDLPFRDVPYLVHAADAGHIDDALAREVALVMPVLHSIRRAPPRSRLAELSEARSLEWLKRAVRPVVARPEVAELAYKAKIIQDVYSLEDDSYRLVSRAGGKCGDCRKCEDVCPTGLSVEEIGVKLDLPDCIQCLYCWWVCPQEAITLSGDAAFMTRQIDRYKGAIESL